MWFWAVKPDTFFNRAPRHFAAEPAQNVKCRSSGQGLSDGRLERGLQGQCLYDRRGKSDQGQSSSVFVRHCRVPR